MFKPDSDNHARLNRRQALLFPAAADLGVASATTAQAAETKPVPAGGTVATPRSAVAKTQYGKVRGYVDDGVLTFKGVPYGASTEPVASSQASRGVGR